MNPIDYIGANVSAEELDLMPFEERDAVESAQGARTALSIVDDRPARPGTIRAL
jgi:hypothetical protein